MKRAGWLILNHAKRVRPVASPDLRRLRVQASRSGLPRGTRLLRQTLLGSPTGLDTPFRQSSIRKNLDKALTIFPPEQTNDEMVESE